ncbi:MAG: lamin tail domain-containing protein, partial [Chloroflexi bacterium]|nr:lamin tail domain-containing protein [Chloroflexota bacterium]
MNFILRLAWNKRLVALVERMIFMWKRLGILGLFVLVLAMNGCESEAEPMPTTEPDDEATAVPDPTPVVEDEEEVGTDGDLALPSEILISEVLLGAPGNNRLEFIELYNTESEAHRLDGWSLWYRLNDSKDEELIMAWEAGDAVPGLGHYLLVHEEQDVGIMPDAVFAANLSERKGGLVLRSPWGDIDKFGWGEAAPTGYFEGTPMTAVSDGPSLERLPGGEAGNDTNTFDNSADFIANAAPNPQNSGSPMTP